MTFHLSTRVRPAICTVIAIAVYTMATSLIAGTSSANAAVSHSGSHSNLHCRPDLDEVAVAGGMTVSVRPGESVRLAHSLYRWTAGGWVLHTSRVVRSYPTSSQYVATTFNQWHVPWYFLNGTYDYDQGMPLWGPRYGVANGQYYAIVEDIKWFTSNGTMVDQDSRQLTLSNGQNYCSL